MSLRSRLRSRTGLYRDQRNKKICGVCAGIGEYLAVETWQVRAVALGGLFFMGQVVVPAYFIAYFLMEPKPYYKEVTDRFDESYDDWDDEFDEKVSAKVSRQRRGKSRKEPEVSTAQTFRTARRKFSDIEEKLRLMESHVTSSKFELQRELKKISAED